MLSIVQKTVVPGCSCRISDTKSLRFDLSLRDRLTTKGNMFLDITKFKPMHYSGFTLHRQDKIESQVVLDFRDALAKGRSWRPIIDPITTNGWEVVSDGVCAAECCSDPSQVVHEGDEVDYL